MTRPELEALFSAWRAEPLPRSAPHSDEVAATERIASALRRVAEQKRRKRALQRIAGAIAVAASVCAVGVGAWFELRGPQAGAQSRVAQSVHMAEHAGDVAVTDSLGRVLPPDSVLGEGYGVRTEQGSARLGFPSGAHARVAAKSSLKITAAREGEAFFLAHGGVEVQVPKLGEERGFFVETPDARVTVHGTRFEVRVEPMDDGPRTHVSVTHGIVSVQHGGREVFLGAGQSWPSSEQPVSPDVAAGASDEVWDGPDGGSDRDAVRRETQKGRGKNPSGARESGQLRQQNLRFARAMHLKKSGAEPEALRVLEQLIRRYPGSPLMQELRVERLRLLRKLGRTTQAEAAARGYLRDFPRGYARFEAQQILTEQP